MGKTGGGRGTNGHKIRGVSVAQRRTGRDPEQSVILTSGLRGTVDWAALLREYPTYPDAVQAVPEPEWSDLSPSVARFSPKGVDRAVRRYTAVEATALFNDIRLENIAFTEPEVVKLLSGGHVAGHTEGEENQLTGLIRASDYMLNRVMEGNEIEPAQAISDDIHGFIAADLGLKSIAFRGNQREQYEGPRVRLDRGDMFRALDSRLTHEVLDAGLERISAIRHPLARAATWAAFATYEQFYLDGNKRTGRYVMNAVAMSHGYDAVLLPQSQKSQYEDAIVKAYRTADLTPHIEFLLGLYRDS
jgi:hypothetical protein